MPPIVYYDPAEVVRVRSFTLTMTMGGTNIHKINNRTFELTRIDEEIPKNDLEEWRIVNGTSLFHPMHIHGVLFQVFSRNGNTDLPPTDRGWKDTVLVHPGETVRVLVRFTDYAGIYLLHCHNLEHEDDGMMMNFRINDTTGVMQSQGDPPSEFRLHQNYPNPFNPATTIKYDLPHPSHVSLSVYDVRGREVATLLNHEQSAGTHTVQWDASGVGSGVYFYRLKVGGFAQTKRMLLLR
jgi:uncharacterized cupredoxin-like copper-binding protein